MKTTLITLGIIAGVLALVTYFVVFFNSGNYAILGSNSPIPTSTSGALTPSSTASSTASSTGGLPNAFSSSTNANGESLSGTGNTQVFSSEYTAAPITWPEGQAMLSITGASLNADNLTFAVKVVMGSASSCIPMNLRLVADDSGSFAPPQNAGFTFPESNGCTGAPGATYTNQQINFVVDPASLPLLFTTGGGSDIFFQVATTSFGGLTITIPGRSG